MTPVAIRGQIDPLVFMGNTTPYRARGKGRTTVLQLWTGDFGKNLRRPVERLVDHANALRNGRITRGDHRHRVIPHGHELGMEPALLG